jgi:Fur family transcriptional regulator, ferric uptake regulator
MRTKDVVYRWWTKLVLFVVAIGSQLERPLLFPRYELLNHVEAWGVRLTAQRRALIETTQEARTHPDAARLLQQARKRDKRDPNIDRATVYLTFELLKKLGMIDELDLMHLNGERHYYELKTKQDHQHLVCFESGETIEFATSTFERLKGNIATANQFEIEVMRLGMGGLCGVCTAWKKTTSAVSV